jgi:hypothetical protein
VGYCYAHALNRFAPAWAAPIIHLLVCVAAVMTLPFSLPEWSNDVPSGNAYLWLVGVLTVGVGLPFFATSVNAPLLQAWFSRSGHPHANDPYFLYGASNLGSLVSLLSYPFLIEPMFGLDTQRVIWASGFGILMLMLGACAVLMLSTRLDIGASSSPAAVVSSPTISNKDRFSWVGLAFIPSALLVAFTTHITTDIASAPFLWVIPLATFLGTFVIVFRDRSMIPHWAVLRIHPLLVASAILFVVMPNAGSTVVQAVLGFATFVVTTLVCHRALYEQRPAAAQLTEFYLYMSLGGVLGGMFAALLAPQLFNTVVEYPLLIVIGLLARPGAVAALRPLGAGGLTREKWLLIIATIAVVILQLTGWLPAQLSVLGVTFFSLLLAGLIVFAHARLEIMSLSSVLAIIVTLSAATAKVDSHSERSFFGVSRVMQSADGGYRLLVHGSTVHGGQKLRDADGSETKDAPPIMYYHPASPMARGFDLARTVGNASSDRLNCKTRDLI